MGRGIRIIGMQLNIHIAPRGARTAPENVVVNTRITAPGIREHVLRIGLPNAPFSSAGNGQRPSNPAAASLQTDAQTPGMRAESAQTCVLRPSAGSAESLFRPILGARTIPRIFQPRSTTRSSRNFRCGWQEKRCERRRSGKCCRTRPVLSIPESGNEPASVSVRALLSRR